MIKKLDRILVSVKIPKYDAFELESLPNHIQLKSKNFISKFEASKLQHETKVASYLAALKETHKNFDVVKLNEIKDPITGYDLVVTLGGDGTFLRTAAFIRDETPIMGLNTDSERSYCAFCSYQPNVSVIDPKIVWNKLLTGDYSIINRTRMKISISGMESEKSDEINEECEALNEIFFADRDVGKTSNFRLAVDNQEFSYQKSGGIIVATGSGSTGWIKSARDIDVNTVIDIVRAREGKVITIEEAEAIAFRATYKYMLAQDDRRLLYHIREPILQKMANYNGRPNSGIANEIKIQSELKYGVIVIDGNITRDVNFGEIIHLTPSQRMLHCVNFSLNRHDTLVKGAKIPTLKK